MPGLIDLHTHIYEHSTNLGVNPTTISARSGSTVLVDAGSSGAGNFIGLKHYIMDPSRPLKIFAFLNISYAGIFAHSEKVRVGECHQMQLLNIDECARVCLENLDSIVGVKVRVGSMYGKGIEPLDLALAAA